MVSIECLEPFFIVVNQKITLNINKVGPMRFELTTTGSLRAFAIERCHIRPALHQAKLRAQLGSRGQVLFI